MTKGATLTSPRTYLTQHMCCMLARCLQLWFSGSVASVTQGAQQPCKSLLGLSGKGLVARGGTITFPCGDSNLGSLQGQEPQGSWCLWPSHAESRNVELLSCNSPRVCISTDILRRKERVYSAKQGQTCIFITFLLASLLYPSDI